MLGALFENVPSSGDLAHLISQRLELNDRLRIPRTAVFKYYSDIPFFQPAVDVQRERCERFLKPEDLPSKIAVLVACLDRC